METRSKFKVTKRRRVINRSWEDCPNAAIRMGTLTSLRLVQGRAVFGRWDTARRWRTAPAVARPSRDRSKTLCEGCRCPPHFPTFEGDSQQPFVFRRNSRASPRPSRTAVPTPVQTAIHVAPTPRPTHAQLFSPFNHSDIQTVPPRRSASCLRCSIQSWSTAGLGMFALTSAHTQSCAEPRLCIRTYCVRTRSTGHETARGS